jgi:hypothetical protein
MGLSHEAVGHRRMQGAHLSSNCVLQKQIDLVVLGIGALLVAQDPGAR